LEWIAFRDGKTLAQVVDEIRRSAPARAPADAAVIVDLR